MIGANSSTGVSILGSVLSDCSISNGQSLLCLVQSKGRLWHREQVRVMCGYQLAVRRVGSGRFRLYDVISTSLPTWAARLPLRVMLMLPRSSLELYSAHHMNPHRDREGGYRRKGVLRGSMCQTIDDAPGKCALISAKHLLDSCSN